MQPLGRRGAEGFGRVCEGGEDGFSREAGVRFEELFGGLAGGEFVEDEFDRDARAGDDGLAHHDGGVCLNQVGVHSGVDYNLTLAGVSRV
jgi:hypothetical protein